MNLPKIKQGKRVVFQVRIDKDVLKQMSNFVTKNGYRWCDVVESLFKDVLSENKKTKRA